MKSYHLTEAGLVGKEAIPAFKFRVKMRDGEDLDGKFNIQFAAVEQGEERRFALNSPRGLLAVFDAKDSKELTEHLAVSGEYIVLANYEKLEWSDPRADTVTIPLMGRDLGLDVDYRERYQLGPEEHAAVVQIQSVLAGGEPTP